MPLNSMHSEILSVSTTANMFYLQSTATAAETYTYEL